MRPQPERPDGHMVDLWRGFGDGDIFTAAGEIEKRAQSQPREMTVDVIVPGIRRHRELQTAPAAFLQIGQHAGQDGLARGHFPAEPPMLRPKGDAVGGGAESHPGVEIDIDMTDEAVGVGARVGVARALMEHGPGVDERGFGVDDEPVEVEYQRANHRP